MKIFFRLFLTTIKSSKLCFRSLCLKIITISWDLVGMKFVCWKKSFLLYVCWEFFLRVKFVPSWYRPVNISNSQAKWFHLWTLTIRKWCFTTVRLLTHTCDNIFLMTISSFLMVILGWLSLSFKWFWLGLLLNHGRMQNKMYQMQ